MSSHTRGGACDVAHALWSDMKSWSATLASAAAVVTLASGCASGSGGAAPRLALEETSIVVGAFPSVESAGVYIAQMYGLFAAQGLKVTIAPAGNNASASTQDLINGQIAEKYD